MPTGASARIGAPGIAHGAPPDASVPHLKGAWMESKAIGKKIGVLREKQGITTTELAKRVGISQALRTHRR